MKITDPDIIKNGEKDLIEAVTDDLDLDAVKEVLKKKMAATAISSKGGKIVVYHDEIAFRLNFDIHLSGSLMFDRQGNYIPGTDETDDKENLLSEDFDLDDINIDENTEEVGSQTLLSDAENHKIEDNDIFEEKQSTIETRREELDIGLPDYDLDDGVDQENESPDETKDKEIETKKNDLLQNNIVDDDINDILKESREFWNLKKDS